MQKDTVEVVINEDGMTCTTVNPFGERPETRYYVGESHANGEGAMVDVFDEDGFNEDITAWQQAESERKTYEIKNYVSLLSDPPQHFYKPGSIHQARIENEKAIIL